MEDVSAPLSDAALRRALEDPAITYKSARPFVPHVRLGRVVKVYDGDTITVAAPLYNGEGAPELDMYRFSVRLRGLDSAEMKSHSAAEKALAVAARDALSAKVLGRVVRLEGAEPEKYGRLLCGVVLLPEVGGAEPELDVCAWMLAQNFAVAYDGGAKTHVWG